MTDMNVPMPASTASVNPDPVVVNKRWGLGILAGLAGGIAAGVVLGTIGAVAGIGIGVLGSVGSGFLIGILIAKVGRVSGPVAGLVAVVVALVSWGLKIDIVQAGLLAKDLDISVFTVFQTYFPHSLEVIKGHLDVNPLDYVWAPVTAVVAFIVASTGSLGSKKK